MNTNKSPETKKRNLLHYIQFVYGSGKGSKGVVSAQGQDIKKAQVIQKGKQKKSQKSQRCSVHDIAPRLFSTSVIFPFCRASTINMQISTVLNNIY